MNYQIYQHFRGGLYTHIGTALHTETGEDMIIYSCCASGQVFCRPKDMFHEEVQENDYKGPRFIAVPYITDRLERKQLSLI